jgi:GTP-binding protein
VSGAPHTTRDRNIDRALWRGREFLIVDTGGLDTEADEIGRGIAKQAGLAIEQADLVILVVDGKIGVLTEDRTIAGRVRKAGRPVLLAVNKIDNIRDIASGWDRSVMNLGLGEPHPISAATGKGIGDLLDEAFKLLGKKRTGGKKTEPAEIDSRTRPLRIVIMGKPNVGKSSLMNAILGEERVIVSAIPHTTREPQDTSFAYGDRDMVLVDTAGMRKRARVERGLEEAAMERNKKALEDADVAVLVFDATEDPGRQDKHLAGLMTDSKKGLILVANKWDLVEGKTTGSAHEYESRLRSFFPFLYWAPMVFVSAKTGQRARVILDHALAIEKERKREVTDNALSKILGKVVKQKRPLATLGPKSPRVHSLTQVGVEPPEFLVTVVGEKETVHPSWLKFLERKLRDKFGFAGTPIVVKAANVPPSKLARRTGL